MTSARRRPRTLRALVCVAAVASTALSAGAVASQTGTNVRGSAAKTPFSLTVDRPVDQRLTRPEDRYAVAGGCYTIEAPGQGYLTETGSVVGLSKSAKAAAPLHFQATRLGEYLLATNEGRDTAHKGAWWDNRNYLSAGSTAGAVRNETVGVATAPSEDTEWKLVAAGKAPNAKESGQRYVLSVPSRNAALVVKDGKLALRSGAGTPLVLRHVRDDNPRDGDRNGRACASWPEVETNASGKPTPAKTGPIGRVQGFFESHIHGMGFELFGGELRCGRPWHEYGVEFAIGDCRKERNPANSALEVVLGGNQPAYAATYDPVGWPTFKTWPQNRTLTHEQYYWKWLERAYLGGLRLTMNLLVENAPLCEVYPVKKNSCNEMDSIRLQAKRMFELQDYIDAQSGGPGEGWLRIVASPTHARQAINAGRMGVVLGVETSELFDCREVLDQPMCTTAQIDQRLQEVYDMGVRQMQLINKYDNALAGVTGDEGRSGIVVNVGNRERTGHYWDMRSCPEKAHTHGDQEKGDQHDRTQTSPADATPGNGEGIDALAARVLDVYGGVTRGYAAPVYGPGPHCNSRGLSPLGKHLIRGMIAKGMIFDPDHMSATAQRQALDLIEAEIIPAERARAKRQKRAPIQPALTSSHSWSNENVYRRIYELNGVVSPRTDDAAGFVQRWLALRSFAKAQAPQGYDFGMGYGADTNGLGGQPTPRTKAKTKVDYRKPFAAPIGGVRLGQNKSGLRTFDINTEGVAQYGIFADWFHEVRLAADEVKPGMGKAIIADMLDGPETYLKLWERAVYGANSCVKDQSTLQYEDLHAALGLNVEGFLDAIGQPADRRDDVFLYCTAAKTGAAPSLTEVSFAADGRADEVRVLR